MTIGDIGQKDRIAVLVGDDDVLVVVGVLDLVVGVDRVGARRAVEAAFRRVGIGVGDRRAQIVDVEAVGGERLQIGLDAHGRALSAIDGDEADAGELRNLLRDARVGEVFDLRISGIAFDVMASVRTGASAGLTLA